MIHPGTIDLRDNYTMVALIREFAVSFHSYTVNRRHKDCSDGYLFIASLLSTFPSVAVCKYTRGVKITQLQSVVSS